MGFYAPAQIARDAREHGVEVREVDVNHSDWDSKMEPLDRPGPGRNNTCALRLGMRQVGGMNEEQAATIAVCRDEPYVDIRDIRDRTGVPVRTLERLAAADAFRSMGLDRRQALWQVRAIKSEKPLPLFAHAEISGQGDDPDVTLPPMPLSEHVVVDYQTTGLSLKAHPLSFMRRACQTRGILSTAALAGLQNNDRVTTAGVVLVRQRPGTAKGVVFVTIEDETGIANCVVWSKVMERYRRVLMGARLLLVQGRLQKHGSIIHVVVDHLKDWTPHLLRLAGDDALRLRPSPHRHPRNVRIMPKSRDFH